MCPRSPCSPCIRQWTSMHMWVIEVSFEWICFLISCERKKKSSTVVEILKFSLFLISDYLLLFLSYPWRLKVITTLRWPSRVREGTRNSCLCWSHVVPILNTETRRVSESRNTVWPWTTAWNSGFQNGNFILALHVVTLVIQSQWASVCTWVES